MRQTWVGGGINDTMSTEWCFASAQGLNLICFANDSREIGPVYKDSRSPYVLLRYLMCFTFIFFAVKLKIGAGIIHFTKR